MSEVSAASQARVRVWDIPVRLVHWLLVVLVAFSWWTAETDRMDFHRYSGYGLLGLVSFRVYWGLVGSSTARFSQFVKGPRAIVAFLRGNSTAAVGHNPLGALSVVALLALLVAQIVLGLFAVDVDGIESGPLSTFVSFDVGRACARWHEDVFNVLLAFIGLHLVAVLYYLIGKKQNLIGAMISGKRALADERTQPLRPASAVRLIIGIALAGALAWAVARAFQFS